MLDCRLQCLHNCVCMHPRALAHACDTSLRICVSTSANPLVSMARPVMHTYFQVCSSVSDMSNIYDTLMISQREFTRVALLHCSVLGLLCRVERSMSHRQKVYQSIFSPAHIWSVLWSFEAHTPKNENRTRQHLVQLPTQPCRFYVRPPDRLRRAWLHPCGRNLCPSQV